MPFIDDEFPPIVVSFERGGQRRRPVTIQLGLHEAMLLSAFLYRGTVSEPLPLPGELAELMRMLGKRIYEEPAWQEVKKKEDERALYRVCGPEPGLDLLIQMFPAVHATGNLVPGTLPLTKKFDGVVSVPDEIQEAVERALPVLGLVSP